MRSSWEKRQGREEIGRWGEKPQDGVSINGWMVALHCGDPQNLCSWVAEPSAGRSVAVAVQSLGRATTLSEKDSVLLPAPEERLSNSCAAHTLDMPGGLYLPGSVR